MCLSRWFHLFEKIADDNYSPNYQDLLTLSTAPDGTRILVKGNDIFHFLLARDASRKAFRRQLVQLLLVVIDVPHYLDLKDLDLGQVTRSFEDQYTLYEMEYRNQLAPNGKVALILNIALRSGLHVAASLRDSNAHSRDIDYYRMYHYLIDKIFSLQHKRCQEIRVCFKDRRVDHRVFRSISDLCADVARSAIP